MTTGSACCRPRSACWSSRAIAARDYRTGLPCCLGFRARLVDVLQRLERQHGRADVARLAVPDQLDLALVLEQDEAVLLRQRLALLDQRDQVALLGVAQFVGFFLRAMSGLLVFGETRSPGRRTTTACAARNPPDHIDEAVTRPALRPGSPRWRPRTIGAGAPSSAARPVPRGPWFRRSRPCRPSCGR